MKITNRKISVIIIIIAWFILRWGFSFAGLQEQISSLQNENAELQDGLNTLPFTRIGRDYLDDLNKTTGKILSMQLMEKAPYYAPPYQPSADEFRLCWVIQFEQASRLEHYFEVWIDANTRKIFGIQECL